MNYQTKNLTDLSKKALAEKAKREKARRHLKDFATYTYDGYLSNWHTDLICDALERLESGEIRYLIIEAPPRHPLTLDTRIPTPDGWSTIGNIQVGDFVFGSNGKPVLVKGKSKVFKDRQLYRVTTDEGESVVVDGSHEWNVRLCRKHKAITTRTTEYLYQRQLNMSDFRKPMVQRAAAIELPEQVLEVDPYLLGIWLGDGSKGSGQITSDEKNGDYVFLKKKIESLGYLVNDYKAKSHMHVNGLRGQLSLLGVLNNKHIPKEYLRASVEQRLSLLQGLMDSDGNVSKDGQCFFSNTNKHLVDDTVELIRSLGVKATVAKCAATLNGNFCGDYWRVSFYLKNAAILKRKAERTKTATRTKDHYIFIEKLDKKGDTQCITVDSSDSLFIVGDSWLLTHNSKSLHVSQLFPAWVVGRDKDADIIVSSYSGDLATTHGRETRNLINSQKYKNVFDTKLAADSTAKGKWNTDGKGAYNAVGVGGSTTGKGAKFAIADDTLKDRKEAESELIRDSIWDWFRSVLRTRLTPDGRICVMQTRWHLDDIIGRLIEEDPWVDYFDYIKNGLGDAKWVRLTLPAFATKDEPYRKIGDPLWPQRYNYLELEDIKRSLGPYEFSALYQQSPIQSGNQEFNPSWYKHITHTEMETKYFQRRYLTIDTAVSQKDSADYTGFVDNRVDTNNFWHLKAWKQRITPDALIEQLFALHSQNKYTQIGIEETVFLLAIKPFLDSEMRKRNIYLPIVPLKHNQTQKEIRIRALIPRYSSGSIFHVEGECSELEFEQSVFPFGAHDDVLDAAAYQEQIILHSGTQTFRQHKPVWEGTGKRQGSRRTLTPHTKRY